MVSFFQIIYDSFELLCWRGCRILSRDKEWNLGLVFRRDIELLLLIFIRRILGLICWIPLITIFVVFFLIGFRANLWDVCVGYGREGLKILKMELVGTIHCLLLSFWMARFCTFCDRHPWGRYRLSICSKYAPNW